MKRIILYTAIALFVGVWWWTAFSRVMTAPQEESHPSIAVHSLPQDIYTPVLIEREQLKRALGGDYPLMLELLLEWDLTAELLEEEGVAGIKRLPRHTILEGVRCLEHLDESSPCLAGCDDRGRTLHLSGQKPKVLPQTYAAATLLLALLPPEQLAGIPQGLRYEDYIDFRGKEQLVSLDTDRYHSEALYRQKPSVAFLASYSNPAAVHQLERQGIACFFWEGVNSIEEVQEKIAQLGDLVGEHRRGALLASFVYAATVAMDNYYAWYQHVHQTAPPKRALVVSKHNTMALLTEKNNIVKQFERFGVSMAVKECGEAWTIPLDRERLQNLQPDYILCLGRELAARVCEEPAFASLPAVQQGQVAWVESAVQMSPSQYLALAYYDLCCALCGEG